MTEAIVSIVTIVVPAIAGLMGIKWQQAKGHIKDVAHQVDIISLKATQAARLLDTISVALEDDKITPSESKIIATQIKGLIGNLRDEE